MDDLEAVVGPRGNNTRDAERIEILGELHGEVMVFQSMAIKEISRAGAQIETGFPLQLEQELVLYRSGLEFIEPSDGVSTVISEFIDAIKNGRRAL